MANTSNLDLAPALVAPSILLANQTATQSGAIMISGALLCFYNGTRWVILDEVD